MNVGSINIHREIEMNKFFQTIASINLIIIIKFIELSKVVLENLQYLPLLHLHSPFQLVVLTATIHQKL